MEQPELRLIGLVDVNKQILLPLKSCSIEAKVQGYVVALNSTLKYLNNGETPVEVAFRFPIEESFAVVGMRAIVNGREIAAETKKKEEAKRDYQEAIASGHTAAFTEEKSEDIFYISLGNLPVKAGAEVHIKLVGELPLDVEGGVRFTLPAVLKQRYTPVGLEDPLASTGAPNEGEIPAVHDFKMTIASEGTSDVTSPTHEISVKRDEDATIKVSLSGLDAQPLKKDLVVLVHQNEPHVPKVAYELGNICKTQCSYMGTPAIMVNFFPQFEVKRAACEFIFLVDCSGSMNGAYIKSASETLVLFLKSIPLGCSFNIIRFGSSYASLFQESVPYNQESLEYAIRHAQSLEANFGGTELLSLLKHIFQLPPLPGLSRQIFILTDGAVSNIQSCIDEVARNVNKCRVFTFGIGSGASTALINGLAKSGQGTSEFIKEGERMQSKVVSSLKKALQPSVTNIEVIFDLPSGHQVLQAPSDIPNLYKGDKVVIYGILKSQAASDTPFLSEVQGKITLKGLISGEEISHSVPFKVPVLSTLGKNRQEFPTNFDIPVIHHLAAKSLLNDWKAGKGWGSTALTQEREQESIQLSIESSVICEHTAFVAIDKEQEKPIHGAITLYDVSATKTEQVQHVTMQPQGYFSTHCRRSHQQYRRSCMPLTMQPIHQPGTAKNCLSSNSTARNADSPSYFQSYRRNCSQQHSKLVAYHSSSSPNVPYYRDFKQRRLVRRTLVNREVMSPNIASNEVSSSDSLNILISIQHANGYWNLEDIYENIMKKFDTEIQCPPNTSKEIWATVIALAYLELHYLQLKDEWELVALKAEMWLNSQILQPQLVELTEKAKSQLKSEQYS